MSPSPNVNTRKRLPLSPLLDHDGFPPPSARVQVEFGARSHAASPPESGDHFLIVRLGRNQQTVLTSLPRTEVPLPFNEFGYAMILADGAGSAASRLAISAFVHLALHFGKWNVRIDQAIANEVMERAERWYQQIDSIVSAHGRLDGATPGMQTTLTGLYSAGYDCFYAHVGHSRAYLCRKGQLIQLTQDHTVAGRAERARPRSLTPPSRDLEHMLTEVIGGPAGALAVDVEHFHLLDGDVVLLCTNGLSDVVDDRQISQVLQRHVTPDEQCEELIEAALRAGARDDATALVARYRIPAADYDTP
jgi:protein phosphatase